MSKKSLERSVSFPTRALGQLYKRTLNRAKEAEKAAEKMAHEFVEKLLEAEDNELNHIIQVLRDYSETQVQIRSYTNRKMTIIESYTAHLRSLKNGIESKHIALRQWIQENRIVFQQIAIELDLISDTPVKQELQAPDEVKTKLVVLDFDQTLAVKNVYPRDINDRAHINIFGSVERYEAIVELLEYISGIPEAILTIVSYNTEKTIKKTLEATKLEKYFKHVLGMESFYNIFPAKSRKVLELMIKENVSKNQNVIFVDDMRENCHDVVSNIPGAKAIWVKDRAGLTHNHADYLMKWTTDTHSEDGVDFLFNI